MRLSQGLQEGGGRQLGEELGGRAAGLLAHCVKDWPDPDSIFQATLEGGLNHGRFPRLLLHLGPLPPLPVQLPLEEIS